MMAGPWERPNGKVSGFLMGLSVIGSIFNITGIAINRYCYICHSFSYDKLYSYRNTLLLVVLIWVLTIVAIVPNFSWARCSAAQRSSRRRPRIKPSDMRNFITMFVVFVLFAILLGAAELHRAGGVHRPRRSPAGSHPRVALVVAIERAKPSPGLNNNDQVKGQTV
ncbi:hypothetical protein CRUP_024794 [Coryphaenoides rupestris]|nr:hypothetical protein CRUP_024794 [Coryphaenoides rupestris]